MSKRKRQKVVWESQWAMIRAWLQAYTPKADASAATEGVARAWWKDDGVPLRFEGASCWSHWYSGGQEELARVVRSARGRWVVLVRVKETESLAYRWRREAVERQAANAKLVCVQVEQFDDQVGNQRWWGERVMAKHGQWRRARNRYRKAWHFGTMVRRVRERAAFEQVFGLRRTREEAEVRATRVQQALVG